MKKYLSTIHQKSDSHKRRFAFLVSASFTLFIFGIWSFLNYGARSDVVAESKPRQDTQQFERFRSIDGVASAFHALRVNFGNIKETVEGLEQVR
jgi:hypothetical protein